MNMKKILLAGEAMGLLIAREEKPLDQVESWDTGVAGAELNVAVGLARLGHHARYLTRVGNDPFGMRIERVLRENGVDASLAGRDPCHPTGFMLKGKVSRGDPPICYFRKGSAASFLLPEEVESMDLSELSGGIFHMTGIFPALSPNTLDSMTRLMERAREAGMTISFDPNLRPQLWPDQQTMAAVLNRFALQADILLPGCQEGEILCGTREPEGIAGYYLSRGVTAVVVKTGSKGAYGATAEKSFFSPAYHAERIVDTVGAGDGFAAGVLSALAEDLPLEEGVRRGNAIGTLQVMSPGDSCGLPDREGLARFMAETPLEG